MRLDGVEVKVSLDSDQTAEAVQALNLADVTPWKIFFVEDITTGLCSATPLLDQHLIVRARQKTKGKDDVTVKFRPGRRSQLTDSWLATTKDTDGDLDSELKVEEDWAGCCRFPLPSTALKAWSPPWRPASVASTPYSPTTSGGSSTSAQGPWLTSPPSRCCLLCRPCAGPPSPR